MKKRFLLLDFTSLLDVIMIILFFFIIFSRIETDEVLSGIEEQQNQIAAQQAELDAKNNEVNEMLNDASEKLEQAQMLLDEANIAVEHSGENVKAISDFSQNQNIKLNLIMKPETSSWTLVVIQDGEEIAEIDQAPSAQLTESLKQVFLECGYTADNTILIELFIDETESGTNAAYMDIDEMFSMIRNDYPHCYFSETDKSLL